MTRYVGAADGTACQSEAMNGLHAAQLLAAALLLGAVTASAQESPATAAPAGGGQSLD